MAHRKILMSAIIAIAVFLAHMGMVSAGESVTEVSELYTISASTYPANLGPQPSGSGTYEKGTMVTLEASQYAVFPCPPDEVCTMEAYPFFRWSENGITVSNNSSYTFIINANKNLVAVYMSYGPTAMDINSDNFVNFDDVLLMVLHWTQNWAPGDFNGDNIVNFDDILLMIPHWGACT